MPYEDSEERLAITQRARRAEVRGQVPEDRRALRVGEEAFPEPHENGRFRDVTGEVPMARAVLATMTT
jgi:hypothetical protein